MSAIRYDRYDLDSATVSTGGDRFSPKITVGVTPVAGFTPYVSYAEGYRAPSITETLIAKMRILLVPRLIAVSAAVALLGIVTWLVDAL